MGANVDPPDHGHAKRVRALAVAVLVCACSHAPVIDARRLTLAGRWDESIATLERELERGGDRAHLLVLLSDAERERALARGGDLGAAIARAEQARAAAQSPGAVADAIDAAALTAYWRTLLAARGDWGPIERGFREALELRRALGDHGALADSLFHVGLVAQMQGRYREAADWFDRALAEAKAAADPLRISFAIRHQADLASTAGQLARALDLHRESLRLRKQAGFTVGVAYALIAIAALDPTHARADLDRARAVAISIGHLLVEASVELALAGADVEHAREHLDRAVIAAHAARDVQTEIDARLARMKLAASNGDCESARADLEAARQLAAGTDAEASVARVAAC